MSLLDLPSEGLRPLVAPDHRTDPKADLRFGPPRPALARGGLDYLLPGWLGLGPPRDPGRLGRPGSGSDTKSAAHQDTRPGAAPRGPAPRTSPAAHGPARPLGESGLGAGR